MYKSKIPNIELRLEEQHDEQTVRSFIDNTDHLQFRCKCDEWYIVKIVDIDVNCPNGERSILLELTCPLCGDIQKRKTYVNMNIYSSDIEHFINAYKHEFEDDNKKELLYELGRLKLGIDLLMEDIGKDYNLKVPTEDEIIKEINLGIGKFFPLSEEQIEIQKRKKLSGFNEYISKKYGKWGRVNLRNGNSELDILMTIHKSYSLDKLDEEDKKFLTKEDLDRLYLYIENMKNDWENDE